MSAQLISYEEWKIRRQRRIEQRRRQDVFTAYVAWYCDPVRAWAQFWLDVTNPDRWCLR